MGRQKLLLTVVAVLSAVAALTGVVDDAAGDYADKAFKRALVTFAVARTLNGAISLAQGTEVALEPGGVGVNLAVGEILDPINDLVEQFSSVMLVAASSLGLQSILLKITAWWFVTALLVLAAVFVIATLWIPKLAKNKYAQIITRSLLLMLCIRFIVPVLIIGTNLITDTFLTDDQAIATAALEATSSDIEELSQANTPSVNADSSMMDRLSTAISESLQSMNVEGRLNRLKDSATNASEHIINLIVLFVLQTILLPLLFVWLLMEALKRIFARSNPFRTSATDS